MNLPNKLSIMRLIMVPFCIIAVLIPAEWLHPDISALIAAAIFIAASITDMIDGKIARKYNLITDFGKFIDPLADKFLVIGTLLAILYRYTNLAPWMLWIVIAVIFRELAVTSIRLVTSTTAGIVVAASMLGKIKTVMQIVAISTTLIEPVLYPSDLTVLGISLDQYPPLTIISSALMLIFTILSGIDYLAKYWKYLDYEK